MSIKIRRREATLLLATLGIGTAACEERKAGQGVGSKASADPPKEGAQAKKGPPGVTADTIKIGSYGPLSGPAAAWGVLLHAMNAYFAHINEKGGIHGRKIEFIYRDDQYNPAKTPAVARELVEKEDVFCIVGGIGTANGRAVADFLETKGVPYITPASGDQFWSEGGKKNIWTAFPKYLTEGAILGNYAGEKLEAKKVTVLYQDDDFGKQGLEGVKKGLGDKGKVVAEISVQPTDTELGGQVSKIVEAGADVLVLYCGIKQAVAAVKMLEAQKKKPKILTSFVLGDPMMFKLAGDAWNGTISSMATKLPTADDPSINQYREVLKKHGGGKLTVGNFTLAGMVFATPVTQALELAGKDLTRDKFIAALNKFDEWPGPGPHWEGDGFGPTITWNDKQRLASNKIFLAEAKDGKWEKLTDWLAPPGGEKDDDSDDDDTDDDFEKELEKELLAE